MDILEKSDIWKNHWNLMKIELIISVQEMTSL